MNKLKLGVNIDHIATLRQARGGSEPEPVFAAKLAELGGADGITVHLREDRRHIQDRDLYLLKETISVPLNLEMACSDEIIEIAKEVLPHMATLVPEKRKELTTEGGLDVCGNTNDVEKCIKSLKDSKIIVSLFIEPDKSQIELGSKIGADFIEIHTGKYANLSGKERDTELARIIEATEFALELGLKVNAGHGLNYNNIQAIVDIGGVSEVNIGHSIISRAVFVGIENAVRDMKSLLI